MLKTLQQVCLAGIGTIGLLAGGLAQAPDRQLSASAIHAGRVLTQYEEAIVKNPFPSESATHYLRHALVAQAEYRRLMLSLPVEQRPQRPDNGGMGWAISSRVLATHPARSSSNPCGLVTITRDSVHEHAVRRGARGSTVYAGRIRSVVIERPAA